ncbi:MAG: hypothetical protein WCH98_10290 [Verrucomicrobiota bacterium]
MKTILTAALLFASVVSGYSQTTESKLVDRIMKPNMELGNPMRDKSYSGTTAVPLKGSPVASQGFYGVKDATVKDFSTRSFFGLKNPWFGSKVFDTKDAPAMSIYDVKQARFNKTTDTTGYYAAKKGAHFGSPVVPLSTYVPAPSAKGAVSGISDKVTEKMTIEEVRDLLNKNR